ncbi:MAG: hypothetical protein Q9M40_14595 [Sulfurimonas sp.]|nr:hypothetical protein [Sulfurimonas sp.]
MFRSISPITLLFFVLTAVFFTILIQLYEKFTIEEKFSMYHKHLYELRILEKDFNIFLLNPIGFLDYDKITTKRDRFELLLSELEDSDISKVYNYDFETIFKTIEQKYMQAAEVLEYQKSLHAMSINQINYLFDLHHTLAVSSKISVEDKIKTGEIIFYLMQFLNGLENKELLSYKISVNSKDLKAQNLIHFYKHAKNLFDEIEELSKIFKEYEGIAILVRA